MQMCIYEILYNIARRIVIAAKLTPGKTRYAWLRLVLLEEHQYWY